MIKIPDIQAGQRVRLMTKEEIIDTYGEVPKWVVESMYDYLGEEVTVSRVGFTRSQPTTRGMAKVKLFTIAESPITFAWSTEIVEGFFPSTDFDVDADELDRFLGGFS